jgi:large subunit ribosomal protein L40e
MSYIIGKNERVISVITLNNKQLLFKYTIGTKTLDDVMNAIIYKIQYKPHSSENFTANQMKFIVNDFCWPDDYLDHTNKYELLNNTNNLKLVMEKDLCHYITRPIIKKKLDKKYENSEPFQLMGRFLTGKYITLNVTLTDTIYDLKEKINEKEGIQPQHQNIIFGGNVFEDDKYLYECDINKNTYTSFHVITRLRGGMYMEVSGKNGDYKPLNNIFYDLDTDSFIELP